MTTINNIIPIHGKNLSAAWTTALEKCLDATGGVLAPAIVTFDVLEADNTWNLEIPKIRQALENQLDEFNILSANQSNVETVAGTIFPESIWKRCGGNREKLFEEYNKSWHLINKCNQNARGTYFRRLTAFGEKEINQIKMIIDIWHRGIHRHSALQAGIFDPAIDHRATPILGFPCLQQVVFHPHGANGRKGMTMIAFYANQLLLEKAYGNYLGLYRLGKFMADEMGMVLRGVTCIASNLSLSYKHNKRECFPLLEIIKKELHNGN